jgi:hypothetical protein
MASTVRIRPHNLTNVVFTLTATPQVFFQSSLLFPLEIPSKLTNKSNKNEKKFETPSETSEPDDGLEDVVGVLRPDRVQLEETIARVPAKLLQAFRLGVLKKKIIF